MSRVLPASVPEFVSEPVIIFLNRSRSHISAVVVRFVCLVRDRERRRRRRLRGKSMDAEPPSVRLCAAPAGTGARLARRAPVVGAHLQMRGIWGPTSFRPPYIHEIGRRWLARRRTQASVLRHPHWLEKASGVRPTVACRRDPGVRSEDR